MLHQFRTRAQAVQERAEALRCLSTSRDFRLLRRGNILRGWALAMQGQEEEGSADTPGPGRLRATGTEVYRPYYLALLAEAYGKTGQVEEGLTALAEALAVVDRTGERCYEAELYRLQGELTLQQCKVHKSRVHSPQPQGSEAEACFQKAIEIARRNRRSRWNCGQ